MKFLANRTNALKGYLPRFNIFLEKGPETQFFQFHRIICIQLENFVRQKWFENKNICSIPNEIRACNSIR